MQQPQQQFVPVYVPYFNAPRVAAPQDYSAPQQPAPMVYQDQAPAQHAVYPQVPLVEQQQPAPMQEQAPAQQQSCPFSRAACGRGRCCKRVDARKALAVFALAPLFLYGFVYIASLFSYTVRYNSGNSFLFLIMTTIGAVLALAGSKKSNIVVLGIFIGMTTFSTVAAIYGFGAALGAMFHSVLNFAVFVAEFLIGMSKICGIIAAAKLIKKIRMETSLPQFIEQQHAEQQAQEQQVEQQPQLQVPAPAPVAIAPQAVPQPQVVAAPMYPQLQQFQAPIIAPVVPQQAPQQYATELQLLKDMGFGDAEKNIRLLQKHNGSLQQVVMEYVQA